MSIVKSVISKFISSRGYTLYKNSFVPGESGSMLAGLRRLSEWINPPDTILDIGAAEGVWTEKALTVWPTAKYELIEPLSEQIGSLDTLKKKHANINYHLAVAGERPGEIGLNVSSDLDGSGIYSSGENVRMVPVIPVNQIAGDTTGSILIKFDTHGYEVPILKGSEEVIKRVSALVIEVYGFKISPSCLLFHELSAHLEVLGFGLIDIVDVVRRPFDQAFWQADAFYIRKDSPVFQKNIYV